MRLLCSVFLLLSFPTILSGQARLAVCRSPQIELSFQGVDGPDFRYTYAANLRNISREACSLRSQAVVFSLVPERPSAGFKLCEHCGQGEQPQPGGWINLAPGESAHKSLSWKTSSPTLVTDCVRPKATWLSEQILFGPAITISTPLLWKPICSVVQISDLTAGRLAASPASASASIQLLNRREAEHSASSIPVALAVNDPAGSLATDDHGCPVIFVELRGILSRLHLAPGQVDEVRDVTCEGEPVSGGHKTGQSSRSRRWKVKLDAAYLKNWELGDYTLSFSALEKEQQMRTQVAQSENLRISVGTDGMFIHRNWGQPVNGLTVDLTLEKDTYEIGSDIPLYVARANFSQDLTVFSPDPVMDPPGVGVVVRNADGEEVQGGGIMTGHGTCEPVSPGMVLPWGLSLRQIGLLPQAAGTYTIFAVWRSRRDRDCFSNVPFSFMVRSNPVTFRVVEKVVVRQ